MAELAALGTIGGIAASGTKVAIFLYSFSTTVAGAKKEVLSVADSITLFCTVLNLLGSTLEKQNSARFSANALSTVYEILGHCRRQFDDISAIVDKLKKEKEIASEARAEGMAKVEVKVDAIARIKWVFKRGEVKKMQRDLDSMKLTLGIMLQALRFKEISLEQRYSAAQKATELAETQCVADCLLTAQNANEEEIALLEEETDDPGQSAIVPQTQSWRASTYNGISIDTTSNIDISKQFQNLVHMWAEDGESSGRVKDGKRLINTEGFDNPRIGASKDQETNAHDLRAMSEATRSPSSNLGSDQDVAASGCRLLKKERDVLSSQTVRRQFSFDNLFFINKDSSMQPHDEDLPSTPTIKKREKAGGSLTEEERLGLVHGEHHNGNITEKEEGQGREAQALLAVQEDFQAVYEDARDGKIIQGEEEGPGEETKQAKDEFDDWRISFRTLAEQRKRAMKAGWGISGL